MDISKIPKNIIRVLQDRELSMSQKMVAFTLLMPQMPRDPTYDKLYNDNLETGNTIKRLVDEGKITLGRLDKDFKLNIITNSQ